MNVKRVVKSHYSRIAREGGSCCGSCSSKERIAGEIGYSKQDLESVGDANLGLGCGNPTALAGIKEGDVVLDLGSGAGIDCFLASKRVGKSGHVIGIDFSADMLKRAKANAKRLNYSNVEFKKGDIEDLPIDDGSIDVIISNCVINLAPNKARVFSEAFRVLRKGGRMYVSDIVLLDKLSDKQLSDKGLVSGCVAGALLKDDYLGIIKSAGFTLKVLNEDRKISKTQYQGIPLESLKVEAIKN